MEIKLAVTAANFIISITKGIYNEKRIKLIENKLNFLQSTYPNFFKDLLKSGDEDIYYCFENMTRFLLKSTDLENEELVYDFIVFLINKYLEGDFEDLSFLENVIRNFTNADYKYLKHFLDTTKKVDGDLIFEGPSNMSNISYEQFYNELVFMDFAKLDYCILDMAGARLASTTARNKRGLPYDIKGCFKNEKTKIIIELYEEFLNSNMYQYRLKCNDLPPQPNNKE